ncbi:hypothetical protein [Candidatus Nitrospira neomarina]|uniref:Lipoprotein SmpA/OmlA domain-containing protein n=1 Tax=Candidatus Nitrospira neomarina TaxID=3020899 RepID=A0AA96K1X3_9BACT|nr:hypothetical protein [Candidatus Nitrospira neomarina]WNM63511.1 hypothetical protein PQG83_07090 [Candidatus Nitrospira neomarina]
MRSQQILLRIWVVLSLIVSGCVSGGNPSVMDQELTAQIQLNTSTKEDVRQILGQPNGVSRHSGSYSAIAGLPLSISQSNIEVWSYSHMNVDVDAATFIPIVGFFAGGATSNMSTFTVVFDENGIVRHISTTQTQGRSGLGAGSESKPMKPVKECQEIDC